jgi:hypothetical protein
MFFDAPLTAPHGTSIVLGIRPTKEKSMKRILIATLVMLLTAGVALAGPGGGRGPGGPGPDGPGGGDAIVLADGTLIVTRHVVDTATDTSTTQLLAITPAGTTAWNVTLTDGGHLTVSGSNLLSVSSSATDTAVTSTVTARSTATGAVAWTAAINGRVTDLEPFSGGTYAVVVTPAAGGTPARSVVAISNSGARLWTASI